MGGLVVEVRSVNGWGGKLNGWVGADGRVGGNVRIEKRGGGSD